MILYFYFDVKKNSKENKNGRILFCGRHEHDVEWVFASNFVCLWTGKRQNVCLKITNGLKILVKRSIQFDINQSKSPNYQSIKVIGARCSCRCVCLSPHYLVAMATIVFILFIFFFITFFARQIEPMSIMNWEILYGRTTSFVHKFFSILLRVWLKIAHNRCHSK